MKVIFINNYGMDWAWEQWKKKEYPGHHLWGVTHFEQYGIDLEILPHSKYTILKKISSKIKILGDLDQELRIIFAYKKYDIVYSGHYFNTLLIAFLRSIGIFKKPVVAVSFQTFRKNLWSTIFFKVMVNGYDKLLCLNSVIRDQLRNDFAISEDKLEILEWGMDLSFYQNIGDSDTAANKEDSDTGFILSAGKSDRDYNTLVKAFSSINHSLKIYCSGNSAPTISDFPSNIKIKSEHPKAANVLSFSEMEAEYNKAYAVAIPLKITPKTLRNPIGLTSLLNAMVLGKAVVITRHRQIDIDIEKEGIGIWVEPGDVKGWQEAISYLFEHPSETKEMGKRGRLLCETKYNIEKFSEGLAKILKDVVKE
ncbi:glycosyltransferase family 4 protein [Limnofasciculus baicalensis]|uniref:Glycosyltransferase family 4 protein n=1 Tax=Limnofasciculus baicalensis BBK-W-15 TaxID=2699891 RepID=A0AAE3KLY7_9CYAN|nr:glycosyltransferase family 4 protein [Limnofasciculus baicalensis]MCP2728624.1 glycosyltransferase family 4 protein [Limnofasciculus baicalensis BBK-W-15]